MASLGLSKILFDLQRLHCRVKVMVGLASNISIWFRKEGYAALLSFCDCKGGNCWHVSAHPQIPHDSSALVRPIRLKIKVA